MHPKQLMQYCVEAVELVAKKAPEIARAKQSRKIESGDTLYGDLAAENIIIDYFMQLRLPAVIMAEELRKKGKVVRLGGEYTVAADPFDGSNNFQRDNMLPYGAIVTILRGENPRYSDILAAAVRSLTTTDIWYACKGGGCFYNGKQCRTSGKKEIDKDATILFDG